MSIREALRGQSLPWKRLVFTRTCQTLRRSIIATQNVAQSRTSSGTGAGIKRPRAKLVNGRAMATEILEEVRRAVDLMRMRKGAVPGLAVIMVGERRDSAKYVSMKEAVAESIGFMSFSSMLPASATHGEVLECIQRYNMDPSQRTMSTDRVPPDSPYPVAGHDPYNNLYTFGCHGILLQLPVPGHLDPRRLLGAIKVEKDVECFNPTNAGRLTAWRRTVVAPCTPIGVMEMLIRLGVEVHRKHAVVLGESSVVGLPMCLLLNEARATVSMVHKETPNPEEYTRRADIVVAATGVPELVRASWVKPGAVVIDVGINFVRDDHRQEGFRVVGDVHPDVREVASIVSPVPGGVGPMTVAMLMRNCANMAFLQSRWGDIAGALNPELAAENARRTHSAIVDLAMGVSGGIDMQAQKEAASELFRGKAKTGVAAGNGDGAVREALERAGESISDAELLTIINDSERNAYGLLSFLELGSSPDRLLNENAASVTECEGAGRGAPSTALGLPGSPEVDDPKVRGADSGEEGSMRDLDEWLLEADKAARERGEKVMPQKKGEDLLIEGDLDVAPEEQEWWAPARRRAVVAADNKSMSSSSPQDD